MLPKMLHHRMIQLSHSLFGASVLLVRKKDGSWHFCVHYRHLNAVTIKDKYHMPVIDEFLYELSVAVFFTKLDVREGYNQIRMDPVGEPKTAFHTHH